MAPIVCRVGRRVLVAVVAVAASACAEEPAPPVVVSLPKTAATSQEAVEEGRRVSVAALAMPSTLEVDGDLREWASIEPPPPEPSSTKGAKAAPRLSAKSHVAVAIGATEIAIAAELREAAASGAWTRFASRRPRSPASASPSRTEPPSESRAAPRTRSRASREGQRTERAARGPDSAQPTIMRVDLGRRTAGARRGRVVLLRPPEPRVARAGRRAPRTGLPRPRASTTCGRV